MALARRAGLSVNYVSIFERGERLPRWKTARLLADALDATEEERVEFFRLIDGAAKPEAAQIATAGLAIPGLIVWKHLPEILFALPHSQRGLLPPAADRVLPDLVAAGAALLGYRAAVVGEPRAGTLDKLRAAVDDLAVHETTAVSPPAVTAPCAVSARLVDHWHGLIFATPGAVQRAVRALARWEYSTGFSSLSDGRLRFSFHGDPVPALPQESVRASWLEHAYNGLTLERLWSLLGLASRFGVLPDFGFYHWPDFRVALKELENLDLAALPERLNLPRGQLSPDRVAVYLDAWETAFALQQDGAFLDRLRVGPAFSEACLGPDWQTRLDSAAARAAELGALLHAVPQRRPPT